MRSLCITLVLATLVSACETVPAMMDQVVFDAERIRVETNPSIASVETALSVFLARTDLTEDQRIDLLHLRADKRLSARYNLPGAVADLDQTVTLRPDGARANDAERRKVFALTEIENAQRRLARLQNLPDWFDDKVLMGDIEDAADRYRAAGITPNDAQLYLLRESGFVCSGEGDSVHQHGPEPEYAAGSVWCSDPSLS